jgi:hypothetical protein
MSNCNCEFPVLESVEITISDDSLKCAEVQCKMKQRITGKDGETFEIGMPVTLDPATGEISPDPTGTADNLWGISMVSKTATADDPMILIMRDGVVCWKQIAAAAGLDATDAAVYWPVAMAFRQIGIYVEESL